MTNLFLHALDVLTVLFAPRDRHRAGHAPPAAVCREEPEPPHYRTPGPYATDRLLDGTATSPVRPYVLGSEQRARRRALWLAEYGISARNLRGVEVG
ncbi:hypothetical protein ACIBAG_30400 [Streptomyces sp. NPDC051243]|uniref:hypothetical protein n=1 Tax=Streptomyces sp. NPDC051243 TaxID=3365646 RepID=UPI0037A15069